MSVDATEVVVDDGATLHVRLDGPVDGVPVLILHGYLGDHTHWDANVAALAESGHRVVRPDHRGHGRSSNLGDEAAYTFDRLRLDALAVADALDLDSFHVVGHSMGGLVAELLAIHDRHRLRSAVFVDCSPLGGSPEGGWVKRLRRVVGYRLGPHRLVRALAPVLARIPAAGGGERTAAERRAALDVLLASVRLHDPAAFVAFGEHLREHDDLRAHLGAIDIPVTVVVGEHEVARLRAGADALAAGIPGARFEVIEGAGHSPPMEQPEAFDRVLLDHLVRAGG